MQLGLALSAGGWSCGRRWASWRAYYPAVIRLTVTPPSFDTAAPFPEVKQWRAAITAGDWPALATLFAALPDADSRNFAVRAIGKTKGSEAFLGNAAGTGDTLALLLLASRYIEMGWAARGSRPGKNTRRGQFARFHEHLTEAERLLVEVTGREPDNAPAWDLRIANARGLELGTAEALRRYQRLAARHPHHYPAQSQILQQLSPKWGGSWDQMYEFARECAAAAPAGTVNPVLVAEAHIERWLNMPDVSHVTAPVRTAAARAELSEAAQRSVLHPAFRPGYRFYSAHSTFAMAFTVAGLYAKSAPHFRAAGRYHAQYPWYYQQFPYLDLMVARGIALLRG
jgi:hypothetical protein